MTPHWTNKESPTFTHHMLSTYAQHSLKIINKNNTSLCGAHSCPREFPNPTLKSNQCSSVEICVVTVSSQVFTISAAGPPYELSGGPFKNNSRKGDFPIRVWQSYACNVYFLDVQLSKSLSLALSRIHLTLPNFAETLPVITLSKKRE